MEVKSLLVLVLFVPGMHVDSPETHKRRKILIQGQLSASQNGIFTLSVGLSYCSQLKADSRGGRRVGDRPCG